MQQILQPTEIAMSKSQILALIEALEVTGKRVGGGPVKFGSVTFSEWASSIVPCQRGFGKRSNKEWTSPEEALQIIFEDRRWMLFKKAIVIATVKRNAINPKDGCAPLAPGLYDTESTFDSKKIYEHQEIAIYGQPRESGVSFSLPNHGIASEFGNLDDSIEIILPTSVSGDWEKLIDIQQGRETATIIITPHDTLLCGGSVNSLREWLPGEGTVKIKTAIEMAKNICRGL